MTQSNRWPLVPLGEVLIERRERPSLDEILSGACQIVSKISFETGKLHFRTDRQTKTGMILIRPGDLVVSGINAYKGAVALYEGSTNACATIHYGSYAVNAVRADPKFLWWLLRSHRFRELLEQHVPGGIKTELKAKRLLPIPIPLPPLEEQRRIVSTIEYFASRIREARELQLRSSSERCALRGAFLLNLSKRFVRLGRLACVLRTKPRNGWSAKCNNGDSGVAVLTLSAVTGYTYDSSAFKRTSIPTDKNAHYWLQPGDLLITRSNTPQLVGHAAIYNGEPHPCIYPDLMMRLDVDDSMADRTFVWCWLQSPLVREFIERHAKGTSPTMKKISQNVVMNIPFPESITVVEQRRIVSKFTIMLGRLEETSDLQNQTRVELDALLPSLLDRAFKGEL